MARRLITYVFICFCVFLLMSQNTSAFSMIIDYDKYDTVFYSARENVDCVVNGNVQSNVSFCTTSGTGYYNITNLVTHVGRSVRSGDIVNFKVAVFSNTDDVLRGYSRYVNNQVTSGRVIGFNEILNDDLSRITAYDTDAEVIYSGNYVSRVYEYFVRVTSTSSAYQIGLNSTSSTFPVYYWYQQNAGAGLSFKIFDVNVYRYKGSEENAEQAEKTQEASDQSEVDSGEAQTDAQGASQSLLSATGSIVSALTSAPATDCLIDISTRQFSVGQVNLCSNVPQGVLTFVHGLIGLVFTPIVLYFCYNVVTTLYNLFKEYNS